jgi:hypothetical protein
MMAGKLERARQGQRTAKTPDRELIDELTEILDEIVEMEREL